MPSAGMNKGDGRTTCERVRTSGSERASEEMQRTRVSGRKKRARVRDSSDRRSSLESLQKDGNERAQVVNYIPLWAPSRWKTALHARASTMVLLWHLLHWTKRSVGEHASSSSNRTNSQPYDTCGPSSLLVLGGWGGGTFAALDHLVRSCPGTEARRRRRAPCHRRRRTPAAPAWVAGTRRRRPPTNWR